MIILGAIRFLWIALFCESELIEQLLLFPFMAFLSIALLPFAIFELVLIDLISLVVLAALGSLKDFFEFIWEDL